MCVRAHVCECGLCVEFGVGYSSMELHGAIYGVQRVRTLEFFHG